jgi:hypothetical protein
MSAHKVTATPCQKDGCCQLHRYSDGFCHLHRKLARVSGNPTGIDSQIRSFSANPAPTVGRVHLRLAKIQRKFQENEEKEKALERTGITKGHAISSGQTFGLTTRTASSIRTLQAKREIQSANSSVSSRAALFESEPKKGQDKPKLSSKLSLASSLTATSSERRNSATAA